MRYTAECAQCEGKLEPDDSAGICSSCLGAFALELGLMEEIPDFEGLPPELVKEGSLLNSAVIAMAKQDPRGTIAKLDDMPNVERHHDEIVIDAWMSQDHRAGLEWVRSIEDDNRRSQLMKQAILTLSVHAPEDALAVTLEMLHSGNGQHPAHAMLQDLAALPFPGSLDKAVPLVKQLPEDLLTDEFMRRFATHAALNSPEKAIQIADELVDDPSLTNSYREGLISQIASKNPVKAAELVEQLPEGKSLERAYESIMRSWTKSDEFAAAEWLAELEPSESRDGAIETFTTQLLPIDPERAVQWASAINDTAQRERQLEKLVEGWSKVDAAAAEAWKAGQTQ